MAGGPPPLPAIPYPSWLGSAGPAPPPAAKGDGSTPPAADPPPPKTPAVDKECLGVRIVAPEGVDPKAVAAVEKYVAQMIGDNKHAQEELKKAKVEIVVIPHDKKMTDLDQFKDLKGTKTFDGRTWDDVRGSGGMALKDGSFALAAPEENLTEIKGVVDPYGKGYSVGMHEFAHTLHLKGLTDDQNKSIDKLFDDRTKAGGPWTEAYGSSNKLEYFAQSTNAFFGMNQGIGQNGREWLEKNDPEMCKFLDGLYGKPAK
ncbi:MAG TPA: hypothetical protein VF310_12815 [Vicinamibacteria bacterium]